MKHFFTLCLAALTLSSAFAATSWEKVTVNGQSRDIKVHVPDNTPSGAALVIACHGMNQSADWHVSENVFQESIGYLFAKIINFGEYFHFRMRIQHIRE